jgi:hypothetical protein
MSWSHLNLSTSGLKPVFDKLKKEIAGGVVQIIFDAALNVL